MSPNDWFKKEKPLLGLLGSGGGSVAGAGGEGPGHTASGGTINDFTAPDGTIYRTHIFFNPGTFQVTALSPTNPAEVEILAVGGGGAGGVIYDSSYGGGGGGGGGVVTNAADNPLKVNTPAPISVASYPITVGGAGLIPSYVSGPVTSTSLSKGHDSKAPTLCPLIGEGGGAGMSGSGVNNKTGGPGGSGGGGGGNPPLVGSGNNAYPYSPVQGYPGGTGDPQPVYCGGGGGGAAQAGHPGDPGPNPTNFGRGGSGRQVAFAGPPTASPIGTTGDPTHPGNGYFGGGGSGSSTYMDDPRPGAVGGGGDGGVRAPSPYWPVPSAVGMGEHSTGGGGGSWNNHDTGMPTEPTTASSGYNIGGSGIYAIRYQLASSELLTAKATGGNITFDETANKTIHAFTQTGTFAAPPTFSETCEYVVIGGGGGGGNTQQWGSHGAGGGGAGGYRTTSSTLAGPLSMTMTVGAGGGCRINLNGSPGGPSVINRPGPQGGTYTATGGGGGGGSHDPYQGLPGGSGGGTTYTSSPSGGGSGNPPEGNPGGIMTPPGGGGGGGGASTSGENASSGDTQLRGGAGGAGIALPTTFIGPGVKSRYGDQGPSTTYGYVAGGGGGGTGGPTLDFTGPYSGARGGNAPLPTTEPWSGGGSGDGCYGPGDPQYPTLPNFPYNNPRVNGKANTGGGGGGGNGTSANSSPTFSPLMESRSGRGGSGLILIAYPT